VDIGPLVQDAVGLLETTLPTTARIALTVDPETPAVLADPAEIEQLVLNLVSNAVQAATESAAVTIAIGRLEASPEQVRSEPDLRVGLYATICVTDSGVGMDRTTTRRVFEPFFTTKAPAEAAGLGLSVVHGIVTRLGGTIRVWSERGVGSRFEVFVPASTGVDTGPSGHEPPRVP
jgi:signal transduction histidine kinase